jgi:hypothetical protein
VKEKREGFPNALVGGVRLAGIRVREGREIWVGQEGCVSITVEVEFGLGGPAPWAEVVYESGPVPGSSPGSEGSRSHRWSEHVNLSLVVSVVFTAEAF